MGEEEKIRTEASLSEMGVSRNLGQSKEKGQREEKGEPGRESRMDERRAGEAWRKTPRDGKRAKSV